MLSGEYGLIFQNTKDNEVYYSTFMSNHGIIGDESSYDHVEWCNFETVTAGVYLYNNFSTIIKHNNFSSGTYGVLINKTTNYGNTLVKFNNISGIAVGIMIHGPTPWGGGRFTKLTYNNITTCDIGIWVANRTAGLIVDSNNIEHGRVGIKHESSWIRIRCMGNTIVDYNYGIYVLNSTGRAYIHGNTMINCGYGIFVDGRFDVTNVSLTCNTVDNCTYGLYCSGEYISRAEIAFNELLNSLYGMVLDSSNSTHIYNNNLISGNRYGIWVDGETSTPPRIYDNNKVEWNEYGIVVTNNSCAKISDNSISNNDYGMYVMDNASPEIWHNEIVNNNEVGIYIEQAAPIIGENNTIYDTPTCIYCNNTDAKIFENRIGSGRNPPTTKQSTPDSSYGIYAINSTLYVYNNPRIGGCAIGVYCEKCTGKIQNNTIEHNAYTVKDGVLRIGFRTVTSSSLLEIWWEITFYVAKGYGLSIHNCTSLEITENSVVNNTHGLAFVNSTINITNNKDLSHHDLLYLSSHIIEHYKEKKWQYDPYTGRLVPVIVERERSWYKYARRGWAVEGTGNDTTVVNIEGNNFRSNINDIEVVFGTVYIQHNTFTITPPSTAGMCIGCGCSDNITVTNNSLYARKSYGIYGIYTNGTIDHNWIYNMTEYGIAVDIGEPVINDTHIFWCKNGIKLNNANATVQYSSVKAVSYTHLTLPTTERV